MRQWYCTGGDIQYGRTCSGSAALLQRHEHLLQTAEGELLADPEWGKKLKDLQGAPFVDARSLEAIFRAAHMKDPETQDAQVEITYESEVLTYVATITATDGTVATLERTIVE
jgi:phage baseplate assembly protein W